MLVAVLGGAGKVSGLREGLVRVVLSCLLFANGTTSDTS